MAAVSALGTAFPGLAVRHCPKRLIAVRIRPPSPPAVSVCQVCLVTPFHTKLTWDAGEIPDAPRVALTIACCTVVKDWARRPVGINAQSASDRNAQRWLCRERRILLGFID